MTKGGRRMSRRLKTFLWGAGLAILIIILIYFEQTAVLYVLATLGMTVLLVIVALADLSGAQRDARAIEVGGDAAAISDSIPASPPVAKPAARPSTRRPRAKRR